MNPPDAVSTAFADKLAALREKFLTSTQQTLVLLRSQVTALHDKPDSAEVLVLLQGELHRVRGTAGSFGFAKTSMLAEGFEARVKHWMDDVSRDIDIRAHLLARFIDEFESSLRQS